MHERLMIGIKRVLDVAEAEIKCIEALSRYSEELGPNHLLALKTISHLDNLYSKQGKLVKVRVLSGNASDERDTGSKSQVEAGRGQ